MLMAYPKLGNVAPVALIPLIIFPLPHFIYRKNRQIYEFFPQNLNFPKSSGFGKCVKQPLHHI
jgi:hypothetical protein